VPSRRLRSNIRRYFRNLRNTPTPSGQQLVPESALAHKYLDGLNGIEIGGSTQNSFGLERTGGYANVDFTADQGGLWQDKRFSPKLVNIVASGDNLPFKDNVLDYVLTSHVIEHFFDPIAAIQEFLRVVKPGGFVFMIVPHYARTFDQLRPLTTVAEVLDRHNGKLKVSDYWLLCENMQFIQDATVILSGNYQVMKSGATENHNQILTDDHHHWSVWDTKTFLDMCNAAGFNVIESHDTDDKIGNGFTVILKK
jgi:ubiquinone/menaquinone biosynthesis C-methylase UbiE